MYKREREVDKSIKQAALTFAGPPASLDTQRKILQTATEEYFVYRKKILAVAYEFLEDESKTEAEQRNRWETHFVSKGTSALQPLKDIIYYTKVGSSFAVLLSEIISQESIFYYKLSNLQLCDVMHARLIKYRIEYNTEKKNLLEKWQQMKEDNQSINVAMEGVLEQLHSIYQSSITSLSANNDKARRTIEAYLKPMNALVGVLTGVSLPTEFTDAITDSMTVLNRFMADSKSAAARLDSLYKNEENVAVIMFGHTRKSVIEFLQKTSFDKCEADYKKGFAHAYEVASNMLTDGQIGDATLFVTNAEKITGKRMQSFGDSYNAFINSNKEIFVGPVGDRTVWDLIRKESWDKAKKNLQVKNIQTELQKIYSDTVSWTNVDIYSFSETTKKEVAALLKKDLDRLNQSVTNALEGRSVWESLHAALSVSKEVMFSKIKNT